MTHSDNHGNQPPPEAKRGDGKPVPPMSGSVPVLRELEAGELKVVGTGFFITRYGLFATAAHVIEDLIDPTSEEPKLATGFILQQLEDDANFVIRRITRASVSTHADVAIAQAENGPLPDGSDAGLPNLRVGLAFDEPAIGERLTTYAYPENEVMKFRDRGEAPQLRGDYYVGKYLGVAGANPFLMQRHFHTSLEIRSGASGSPIFNSKGRVVGIASRGWNFKGAEHEGNNLSSILPARVLLSLTAGCARVPSSSWEFEQIPEQRRGHILTFGELVAFEHVLC